MAVAHQDDLKQYCLQTAQQAREASRALAAAQTSLKNDWLAAVARLLEERSEQLFAANAQDIEAAPAFGLTDAQTDRLRLTPERIAALIEAVDQVRVLADPVGKIIDSSVRPNGLDVQKVRVPLGVVFFIYESRPNVTVDAAALCVKSGNAVILRGGKEAAHSNRALVEVIAAAAAEVGLPQHAVQLVATQDRNAVGHFLALNEWIDVTIPRGGEGLIRRVSQSATMPVIKHFDGNCHVYVDRSADLEMAEQIVVNSKCQRLGVCNTAESLLVHREVAEEFLPRIAAALAAQQVELRGDQATCDLVPEAAAATEEDFRAEYLAPVISMAVVESLKAAVDHINTYGSHHTDAIVTSDLDAARAFTVGVDSAGVFVNASTPFNDGGELGLGAEIGISTDKFHARGPCGLEELTSYKWVAYGSGQLRG